MYAKFHIFPKIIKGVLFPEIVSILAPTIAHLASKNIGNATTYAFYATSQHKCSY